MKVLILSCNTGEGHNSASRAMQEAFLKRDVQCDIYDALSFASKAFSKTVCKSYSGIVLKAPKLNEASYRFVRTTPKKLRSLPYQINALYSQKLYRFIEKEGYDVVICSHLFAAEAVSHIKRHYKPELPCYMLSTDYTAYPAIGELEITGFFTPSEELNAEFVSCGIPQEKLIATGIPVASRFVEPKSKEEARNILGLPQNNPLYLFMTGSMGFGATDKLVACLLEKVSPESKAIVICGKNKKLKNKLKERFSPSRVEAIGFTDKVHLYMASCDVLFTKPGGLSTTEAMNLNIPVVLSGGIPGWETENTAYFLKTGLCEAGDSVDELVEKAVDLVEKEEVRQKMLSAREKFLCRRSAEHIVNLVIEKYAK